MAGLAGLPVYGPITNVFSAVLTLGPAAVLHPISLLFGAGLGLLTATIFIYAAAAISLIAGVTLGEFFARGMLIGASAGANLLIMYVTPWLPAGVAPTVFIVLLLALISAGCGQSLIPAHSRRAWLGAADELSHAATRGAALPGRGTICDRRADGQRALGLAHVERRDFRRPRARDRFNVIQYRQLHFLPRPPHTGHFGFCHSGCIRA